MRILGIDPGYGRMGWGVVEQKGFQFKCVETGVFETPASAPFVERLEGVHDFVKKLAGKHALAEAAVEELFFSRNVKTAILVAQARGVILLALRQAGIPVLEVSPQHVKQALVGNGAASKKQIQWMAARLLGLKNLPRPDDAADALGLALTAFRTRRLRGILALGGKR
jgi:crossover junction endodeoxyribonuclease RuvC